MENINKIRTDLALEAKELWQRQAVETTELKGVRAREERVSGFSVTTVEILDEDGERAIGKPKGTYITLELGALTRREEDVFVTAAELLALRLREILNLDAEDSALVACLGNEAITPDAIGPVASNYVLATRHLKERMTAGFSFFRSVSVLQTGVLGTTGVESAMMVAAVGDAVSPDCVIAVDALASCSLDRLCKTVQICDTGIIPGSGIGNSRAELNSWTLGVPVIAIGVPTVVDTSTLAAEIALAHGIELTPDEKHSAMMVTPKDIDRSVHDISKLIGYSINLALHEGLTVADVDLFL